MLFAIDIDGTIAGRNLHAFAQACSEHLGFQLPEKLTYTSLMTHPAMLLYQQTHHEQFDATISSFEQDPAMLKVLPPLPGAISGVQRLAHFGSIAYYTVRKARPPFMSLQIEQTTHDWLEAQGFPQAQQVHWCMSLMHKWLRLYQRLLLHPEPIYFIDDLACELAVAFVQLQERRHPRLTEQECIEVVELLQRHVTLVAFGSVGEIKSDLRILSLNSWASIDDFLTLLDHYERVDVCHQ